MSTYERFLLFCIGGGCVLFGWCLGVQKCRHDFQNQAVRAGVGRFNEKTAAFEWIAPDVQPECSYGVGFPVFEVHNDWKCE